MMRLTVSAASTVWTVESTRWPVSAALSAVWTVSSSRISPMRMTSGSWRRTRRSARLNDSVSWPTSRWLMTDFLSTCRNSIGSSIVTMCFAMRVLMWSIIAASVVDLPEPVVPVSRMIPRSSLGQLGDDRRQVEVGDRADGVRDRAADEAQRAALTEGVDAEARDAGDRVREVDLVLAAELVELRGVGQHGAHGRLGVFGGQRSRTLDRPQLTVDTCQRRGLNLEMEVGASELHERAESIVDIEHVARIGAVRRRRQRAVADYDEWPALDAHRRYRGWGGRTASLRVWVRPGTGRGAGVRVRLASVARRCS